MRACHRWLAAAAVSLALGAEASGLTVYDPSNHAQNLLQAARALEQIHNQVASLRNQAQMLLNQSRHLAGLPLSLQTDIDGTFARIQGLLHRANGIAYNVETLERQFKEAYPDRIDPALPDTRLLADARRRWDLSLIGYRQSLTVGAGAVENLATVQARTSTLVDASQSAIGGLQVAQAGNQLLAVQSQQLADLTALLAADARADALAQARQASDALQAREQYRRFRQIEPYQPQPVRMFTE